MAPGLRAAQWDKTSTAIMLIGNEPRGKIPASNNSELWKEVLAQDQELISKWGFFPECIYPLLITKIPRPLAVVKQARCCDIQNLVRIPS